jgi:hypothetical protein
MKKDVKGYVGSTRFVCKNEWDVFVWYRFASLDALKTFLGSEAQKGKIDAILAQLQPLAKGGKVHTQAFVADDW